MQFLAMKKELAAMFCAKNKIFFHLLELHRALSLIKNRIDLREQPIDKEMIETSCLIRTHLDRVGS